MERMVSGLSFWCRCGLQVLRVCALAWLYVVTAEVVGKWRRVDSRHRLRAARWVGVAAVLGALLGFAHDTSAPGTVTIAMAKPALPSISWDERVSAFGVKLGEAFGLQPQLAIEFSDWILEAADRQRLEPELLASLIQVESSYRKHARSYVGAIGPAQVQPRYWREFCGGDDLHDPGANIHCGAQVFAYLREACGDDDCALVAYNVGRNSTRKHVARRFVSKVDHHLLQLKTL